MLPTVTNGLGLSASRSKALRSKLSPCPPLKETDISTQNDHKLPSINVSIFLNSPVRSAYEKLTHLQKSKQNPIHEKVSNAQFEFLTEVEQRASSLVETLHLLTTKTPPVQVQNSRSDLQMTLDCAKEIFDDKNSHEKFQYFVPLRSRNGYGNLYHVSKASNLATQSQRAYLTVSLFGVTQYLDGFPEYFDSIERYKRELMCFDRLKRLRLFGRYRMMKTFGLWKQAFRHRKVKLNALTLAKKWRFERLDLYILLTGVRNRYMQLESQMNFRIISFDFPETVKSFFDKINRELIELMAEVRTHVRETELNLARILRDATTHGITSPSKTDPFKYTSLNKIRKDEYDAKSCIRLCGEMISDFHVNIAVSLVTNILQCMGDEFGAASQATFQIHWKVEGADITGPKTLSFGKHKNGTFKIELIESPEEKFDFFPSISAFIEAFDALSDIISEIAQHPYKLEVKVTILSDNDMSSVGGLSTAQTNAIFSTKSLLRRREESEKLEFLKRKIKMPRALYIENLFPSSQLVLELSDEFESHREALTTYQKKLGSMIQKHEQISVNHILNLESLLLEGRSIKENISSLSDSRLCGQFLVDCAGAKQKMIASIPVLLSTICEEMLDHFSAELKSTIDIAAEFNEKLAETTTTQQFMSQNDMILRFRNERPALLEKKQYTKLCYEVCIRQLLNINAVDSAVSSILDEEYDKMEFRIDIFEAQFEDNFIKFGGTLESHDYSLRDRMIALNIAIRDDIFDKDAEFAHLILASIVELKSLHTEMIMDSKLLLDHQRFFNHPESSFEGMSELGSLIDFKLFVWNLMTDLNDTIQTISPQLVENVDCKYFETTSKTFRNTMLSHSSTSEIFEELKQRVFSFIEVLKVIKAFQCPDLKSEHWESIESILGMRIETENGRSQPMIVQNLMSLSAHKFAKEVEQVALEAQNQNACKFKFESIQELCGNSDFIVVPYKDKYDMFCLGKTEGIQNILENSMVELAQLISSPYAKHIKADAQDKLTKLRSLNESFQLLVKLEAEWLRLEPIFDVGDIQRSLPAEFKLFSSTDRFRKGFLKSVTQFLNVMRNLSASDFADSMKRNLDSLDRVSAGLHSYIAAKRAVFPRFFFVSDGDLLSVMAKYKQFSAVSEYVNFFFRGIGSVRILNDGEASVVDIVSVRGEVVPLVRPVKLRGTPDAWLNDLEESMRKQMNTLAIDAAATYHDQILDRWAESFPCQILLLGLNLIMTKSIEAIISSKTSKTDKSSELVAHIEQKLSILNILLNMRLTEINRNKFELLMAYYMHLALVLDKLRQCNQELTLNSFVWTSQLRACWRTVDGKPHVVYRQLFAEIFHDFEFIGDSRLFVVSPDLNRYSISIINAVHTNTNCELWGETGIGKTELVCHLADTLGKITHVVQCFLRCQTAMLMNAVVGSAVCNGWLLLENSRELNQETNSIMESSIETLKNMMGSKDSYAVLDGQMINTTGVFQVFLINCFDGVDDRCKKSTHNGFRQVLVMNPNMEDIYQVMFSSAGFRNDSQLMAKKWLKLGCLAKDRLFQKSHNLFNVRVLKRILFDFHKTISHERNESCFWRYISNVFCAVMEGRLYQEFQRILHATISEVQQVVSFSANAESNINSVNTAIFQSSSRFDSRLADMLACHSSGLPMLILGEAACGKSSMLVRLKELLIDNDISKGSKIERVFESIFPNAMEQVDLMGKYDFKAKRYSDGMLTEILRRSCREKKQITTIIFDGVPLTMWTDYLIGYMESTNSVAVGADEMLHFTQGKPRLIFESDRVMDASPSFLDRLCTFFVQTELLISIESLTNEILSCFKGEIDQKHIDFACHQLFFKPFLMESLEFVGNFLSSSKNRNRRQLISECIKVFTGIVRDKYEFVKSQQLDIQDFMMKAFIISVIWTIGGTQLLEERLKFSEFFRQTYGRYNLPRFPNSATVYDYYINPATLAFCHCKDCAWSGQSEHFVVPVCISRVLLETHKASVALIGQKYSGKSTLLQRLSSRNRGDKVWDVLNLAFTIHTNAADVCRVIDSNLHRISKGVVGSANGASVLIEVDDMSVTQHNCDANSATECIRQLLDGVNELRLQGFYLDATKKCCRVANVQLIAACESRLGIDQNPRLLRHFIRIHMKPLSVDAMSQVFSQHIQENPWQPQAKAFLLSCVVMLFDCFKSVTAQWERNRNVFCSAPTIHECERIMKCIADDVNSDLVLERHWADVSMYHVVTVFVGAAITLKSKENVGKELRLCFKNAYPTNPNVDQELHCIVFDIPLNPNPLPIVTFETFRKWVEKEVARFNDANTSHLKMLLSDDLMRQLATFSKVLSQNGSHLLVSSPCGYQKYCTFRLLSSMLGLTFWEFDSRVQPRDVFNTIVGKIFAAVGGEQDKAVMLVKIDFSQPWNEETNFMLCALHCLIETGDPGGTVSFEDRRKVFETATRNAQSTRSSGMEYFDTLHTIRTRMLSNFHLVFVTDSCENRNRDFVFSFPSFGKKMTLFTRGSSMESWEQDGIIGALIESQCCNNFFDRNDKNQIVSLLGALHTNALQTDRRFSRSNLISCVNMICQEASNYHTNIEQKFVSWETSLHRVQEIAAHLKILQFQSLDLEAEAKMTIRQNEELATQLANAQSTLAGVRESLERLLSERKLKNADLQRVQENIRILLEPSLKDSQSALQSLRTISKSSVSEFINTENPEISLQLLGILISLLFGETPDWKSLRKINSNEGLQVKLFNYDISSVPSRVGKQILKIVEVSKLDETAIEKVSHVGQVLARWLLACIDSLRVTVGMSKEITVRDDLALLVQGIGSQIESQKPFLASQKSLVDTLQTQFDGCLKNLQELQDSIEKCAAVMMRCSKLLKAFENSVPDWTIQLEEQKEMDKTYAVDLVLACFFVSYMGNLDSKARQQVMGESFEICKAEKLCFNQSHVNKCLVSSKIAYNEWIICGLPASAYSLENGLSIRSSFSWPLIYDPHDIAKHWIKRMEQRNNLRVFSCLDVKSSFVALESAIAEGGSILLENLPSEPPSWLVSVLSRRSPSQNSKSESILIDGRSITIGAGFRVYATCKYPLAELLSPFYFGAMTQVNFDVNLETADAVSGRLLASWCMHQSAAYADELDLSFVQSVKQLLEIDEKRKSMLKIPLTVLIEDDSHLTTALQSNLNLSMITSKLNEVQINVDVFELSRKKCIEISNACARLFVLSRNLMLEDERFFVSFHWFVDVVSKLREEIEFDESNSGVKLFQRFTAVFLQHIAEMVPPAVFKSFVFECAIALCRTESQYPNLDSLVFFPKLHSHHVSEFSWNFFLNRSKAQIPSGCVTPEHPYLSLQQLEKLCSLDALVPSLTGVFQSVQENPNMWKDWFENGRYAVQKSRPFASNSDSSFDSLVILCCMFPLKEDMYKEEFYNLIFETKTIVHGLNCLSKTTWTNFANLSYLLVEGTSDVKWADVIVENLRFVGLVENDNLKHVEYSVQNESLAERRLSNIIRAKHNVVIDNVHLKLSWLQMILTKLNNENDSGIESRVYVVLPMNHIGVHFVPFYGTSRKVYCKAKLDFQDNVKLNAEIVLNFESKVLKLSLRKALASFQSILGCKDLFSIASFEIGTRTLKDCLRTLDSFATSAAELSISQDDEKQSILCAIIAHYGGFARDEIQLKRFLMVFCQCLQKETMSKSMGRVDKLDNMDVDTFVRSLSIATVLEFCGHRERRDFQSPEKFHQSSLLLATSDVAKIRQIQAMVPKEIELQNTKDVDWFLNAEIRMYNADVASILGILEDGLQGRAHNSSGALHFSSNCIMSDRVPPNSHYDSNLNFPLRTLLSELNRKRSYFQEWLERGPPKCHDISVYYDVRSFLAHVCVGSNQTSHQGYEFCLKVLRFETCRDISEMSNEGVYVDGLIACRCKWDAKRRCFCSLPPSEAICTKLPICLLSLDRGLQGPHARQSSLPLYQRDKCDSTQNFKELSIATISVRVQDESIESMVGSNACLACKFNA